MGLGANVAGAAAIVGWSAGILAPVFGVLRVSGWLRVADAVQIRGLDACEHGDVAYPEQIVLEGRLPTGKCPCQSQHVV